MPWCLGLTATNFHGLAAVGLPLGSCGGAGVAVHAPPFDAMERRLHLLVVAYIGGDRHPVSCAQAVEAIHAQLSIPLECFSVHKFPPEDFLVVFTSMEFRKIVTGSHIIMHEELSLYFRSWLR